MGVEDLDVGDPWPEHYRGYTLRVDPDGDIWWQLYQGTDRLFLEPQPTEIIDRLHGLKVLGGRVRITEHEDVLTKVEEDGDYVERWLGEHNLTGELVPQEDPEFSLQVDPDGLDPGDLWPSVYDGSVYSFSSSGRCWWHNPETKRRHPVENELPKEVFDELVRHKRRGGSFRVTPWGAVITVIPSHPSPDRVREQFEKLPRVVKNIIRLRKERQDLDMLPVYIGNIGDFRFEVGEPRSLTDELTDQELDQLTQWAESLSDGTPLNPDDHRKSEPPVDEDRRDDDIGSSDLADDPEYWNEEDRPDETGVVVG